MVGDGKVKKILVLLFSLIMIISLLAAGCTDGALADSQLEGFTKDKISQDFIAGNSRFAFDIFRQLNKEDQDQNIFISPLSISTALAMTYQGAGTTTKEVMAQTLGYAGLNEQILSEGYQNLLCYLQQLDAKIELNVGNSLWIKKGKEINKDFLMLNKDIFDASIATLDFSQDDAVDQINQWISEATKGKITKMIAPPLPADVIMYLINAIYFKGDWSEQFDKRHTYEGQFQAGDGSSNKIMMMSKNGKVEYGQGDSFKVVRLPYGEGKVAMYCILPQKNIPISDFIANLDREQWQEIRDSISEKDRVRLSLPRFKLEYGIKNLNDSLVALGMGEAFEDTADFSGIRKDAYISKVLHKAVIEVNEEGSEAAAATAVEIRETAVELEPLIFIADRPFVLLIIDDDTGTILFMGKLYKEK